MTTERDSTGRVLLSLGDVAYALGISRRGVQRLVARGDIPTVRVGKRRLVHTGDLDSFVANHREKSS